jgi:hypothetical protein
MKKNSVREARRNKTKYKDVLIDLLSSKESKTWIYHPNFKKAEAVALQDLEQKIKQEKKNSDERIRIAKENQLKLELEPPIISTGTPEKFVST